MAVIKGAHKPVTEFSDWYEHYDPAGGRDGGLSFKGLAPCASMLMHRFDRAKREMDRRVDRFPVLEQLANGEVISPKPDLPNISSGETAGLVRRIARNIVQNTPNVEVLSKFDDDSKEGIFARWVLKSKIIGSDEYSNDMQQNLFASTKSALTLGFDPVVPVLCQRADGTWHMKYDTLHYRDVFPEPGARDVRQANEVFVRRYLTKGDVVSMLANNVPGWDHAALKLMCENDPRSYARESIDHQSKTRGVTPEGYEVITWYSSSGDAFLTWHSGTKTLLRIEKNKHPNKEHPLRFLVLEKDAQQPLGKSQVELLIGRQDFQDLMLNGAMKLWYRNINPSIISYGAPNATPNLGPGKYTSISNPNARVETFEVNTQTLMQFGTITQQNLGSMVNLIGSADQAMAASAGNGMSATPQGVEAQTAMVDITNNNYQKAVESFFSHYCSYALTMYFQELKGAGSQGVELSYEARREMIEAGLDPQLIDDGGKLDIDFSEMAIEYFVRCVPGSLVEMADEKQLRVLNELFVPLSQALPAISQSQDPEMLGRAVKAMSFIVEKQIELSGASSASDIKALWTGNDDEARARQMSLEAIDDKLSALDNQAVEQLEQSAVTIQTLQEQISLLRENQELMMQKMGALPGASAEQTNSSGATVGGPAQGPSTLNPANA